jgi:hypothetical protein
MKKISAQPTNGFISPEGQFITFDGNETHSELALQILREKNLFADFFQHRNDEYIWGSALKYLLKKGYIRVAESREGARTSLNLEFVTDLYTAQRNVKRNFPEYFGKVNADANQVFFSGNMDEFLRWNGKEQMVQRYSKLKKKKADFGGDFQNISDIAPDPGNVYPGRNREIVKQQTDHFPHKTSGDDDNGEFVHTHPDHCPRYDLRKLKIVDESEDSDD